MKSLVDRDLNNNKIVNLGDPTNAKDGVNLATLENDILASQVFDSQILSPSSGAGDSFANAIQLTNKVTGNVTFCDTSSGDIYLKLPTASSNFSSKFPIKIQKISNDYNRIKIYVNNSSTEEISDPITGNAKVYMALSQPKDYLGFKASSVNSWAVVGYDTSPRKIANFDPFSGTHSVSQSVEDPFDLGIRQPYNFDIQNSLATVTTPLGSTKVFRPKVSGFYSITLNLNIFAGGSNLIEEPRVRIYNQSGLIAENLFFQAGTGGIKRAPATAVFDQELNGTTDYIYATIRDPDSSQTRLSGLSGVAMLCTLDRKTYI